MMRKRKWTKRKRAYVLDHNSHSVDAGADRCRSIRWKFYSPSVGGSDSVFGHPAILRGRAIDLMTEKRPRIPKPSMETELRFLH